MDAPEMFPGEPEVREEALRAGWSPTIGNGWAAVFVSPERGPSSSALWFSPAPPTL
jgi:hypothetical protein